MIMRFFGVILVLAAAAGALLAAEPGSVAVVVYNTQMPGSEDVAEHYAACRHVPANQVIGLSLPTDEIISRATYRDELEGPLLRILDKENLLVFEPDTQSTNKDARRVKEAKIRYIVLCYGVPLKIAEDPSIQEPEEARMIPQFRRNDAAVDSELCLLPWPDPHHYLSGFQSNPFYGATNAALLNPTNGIIMVARLDGPSAAIARELVDKAMSAETNGLWGRAYFDLSGLTNGDPMKLGDNWIGTASIAARDYGFETIVDNKRETFPAGFPMSQIALYAGWYARDITGPFAEPHVEFMPGAFAYHLHSYSAQTLRTTTNHWCGPLLAEGVTATMGCVNEPYLIATPNVAFFFMRWLAGFSYGEAAFVAQGALSWQTTVIGDPLYRPFGQDPQALHLALMARHSPLIEWSHLRVVNLSLFHGVAPDKAIGYLLGIDTTAHSAVLTEKLGDLYEINGQPKLAVQSWKRALKLDPTPWQAVRLKQDIKGGGKGSTAN